MKSWRSVALAGDGSTVLAVCNTGSAGEIYKSTNSGLSWIPNAVASQVWNAAAISADGHKMVAVAANVGFTTGPIYTAQSQTTPLLHVGMSSFNVALRWLVPSATVALQESSDLIHWSAVTNSPALNMTNLQDEVELPILSGASFFRLSAP